MQTQRAKQTKEDKALKPSPARMYSYWLGGDHWLEIDRIAAEKVIELYPDVRLSSRANRAFLRRCASYLANEGITQFIDLGSGLPVDNPVHEVAQRIQPNARVVYVDIDPITVDEAQPILADNPNVVLIEGDARRPEEVLAHPELTALIDWSQPVAVFMLTILNYFVDDELVQHIVDEFTGRMVPGSALAITHGTYDAIPQSIIDEVDKLYSTTTANAMKMRTVAAIHDLFAGFKLVKPGLVFTPLWRPDNGTDPLQDKPEGAVALAGVGRKW